MCPRRVLVRQAEGELDPRRRGGDELYDLFRRAVDWQLLLAPQQCFSVDARVAACTDVPSALLVQMRLRDAICDAIRDARYEIFTEQVQEQICVEVHDGWAIGTAILEQLCISCLATGSRLPLNAVETFFVKEKLLRRPVACSTCFHALPSMFDPLPFAVY